jgi:hypothetical protein
VEFEAGPAANNPGLRAVLRRHAPSATRQRTLEANGIDCGAGHVLSLDAVLAHLAGKLGVRTAGDAGARALRESL